MSLVRLVVSVIKDRATATLDDVFGEVAGKGYTRQQVKQALQNARYYGHLSIQRGKALGQGRGSAPGVYSFAEAPIEKPKRIKKPTPRPVSSVWQLGATPLVEDV